MAGDWIKVEHTMPDKPEVDQLALAIGIDHDAVIGKLIRFWIWADAQSVDGCALGVTDSFLDRLTNCPGFAAGLLKVGWLESRNGRFSVPNFDRHNGQTAKNRALSRDRMKRSRYAPSVTNASPEKRREEKRIIDNQPANQPSSQKTAPASHSDDATHFAEGLADGLAGGRCSGWGLVADRLSSLGASRWREAIAEAKQCGCTPGHAMEIIAHAKQHGYQVGAIIYRLSRARPSLPLGDGWPGKPQEAVAAERKAASKAERLLRERAEADATAMIKALRKQQMPDDEILKRLEAAGLEWPK